MEQDEIDAMWHQKLLEQEQEMSRRGPMMWQKLLK